MKKDDLIILIIGLLLLAGMLLTIFMGGERSRHGVGGLFDAQPDHEISLTKNKNLIYVKARPSSLDI